MKNIIKYISLVILTAGFFACEGPLELDPAQSIDSEKLIVDGASAQVAMNGLYSNAQDLWGGNTTIVMDVATDITDHIGTFPNWLDIDNSEQLPDNTGIDDSWINGYALIYNANVVLSVVPTVSDPALDANQTLGEARALRAWAYYYLTNMFGDVPLIQNPITTLDEVNVAKSSQGDIVSFIISELEQAKGELGDGGAATKITKGGVNAMLAKVYAHVGNWSAASSAADAVLGGAYTLAADYMSMYDGSISSEAIFQLDFNSTDDNSLAFFYWDTPGGRHEIGPSDMIRTSFSADDARAASIADAPGSENSDYQVTKYSDFALGTDKPILLRLADIMLIKAEAEAEQGNYGPASDYLNMVRTRAGLANATLDSGNFKDMILTERMKELAWEGGHRFIDMQRTGRAGAYAVANGEEACKSVWPIPRAEIDANTAMVQNSCY